MAGGWHWTWVVTGTAAVLVASTRAAAGTRDDTTGPAIAAWLAERGYDVWNLELRGHGRSAALRSGPGRS